MTNNPSENIWDEFTKTSKIGPSVGPSKFKCWFFSISAKTIKIFVLSSELGIRI